MRWPWQDRADETHADLETRSYSDAVVAAILANSRGVTAQPNTTGALEAVAGLVGRSFAGARIEGAPDRIVDAITPSLSSLVGRALIRRGEVILIPDMRGDQLVLSPVASHSVSGGPDADTWVYECTLSGPSESRTIKLPNEGVIHVKYACDSARPWRGIGPLGVASLAGRLSAETSKMLADEASSPRGYLMPLPRVDGADPTVEALKADLASAQGGLSLVESTSGSYGTDAASSGPRQDWTVKRIGGDVPASMIALAKHSSNEIYAACGLSPSLFSSDGESGQREAWRRALFSVIAPLGRLVESELRAKLDSPGLTISWDDLRASDLAGRSRSFKQLVDAGLKVSEAARLSGLEVVSAAGG